MGGAVVLAELAGERQPQRDRVVGHLLGAVVPHIGDEDALRRGRLDVDDVDADAVAGDDAGSAA